MNKKNCYMLLAFLAGCAICCLLGCLKTPDRQMRIPRANQLRVARFGRLLPWRRRRDPVVEPEEDTQEDTTDTTDAVETPPIVDWPNWPKSRKKQATTPLRIRFCVGTGITAGRPTRHPRRAVLPAHTVRRSSSSAGLC